jgi:2-C-methyl-D-erythritol 4-phosphate cytidylyltransferase
VANDAGFWCVVPAAGRGERFGAGIPKQYVSISGKPLLLHTLERLAAHPRIAGLMVVLARRDAHWPGLSELFGKPVVTAIGGDERADSVLAGLTGLRARVGVDDFILVHDAARPCIGAADISRLMDMGVTAGGALLAAPVRDTLKRADLANRVAATEPRESRWHALTPQIFGYVQLIAALEAARAAGVAVTDDSMAMERAGHRPLLIPGAQSNIKVTAPSDIELAEFLLTRTL